MTTYYNVRTISWRQETQRSETKGIIKTPSISSDQSINTFWYHFPKFNSNKFTYIFKKKLCVMVAHSVSITRKDVIVLSLPFPCSRRCFLYYKLWLNFALEGNIISFSGLWANTPLAPVWYTVCLSILKLNFKGGLSKYSQCLFNLLVHQTG